MSDQTNEVPENLSESAESFKPQAQLDEQTVVKKRGRGRPRKNPEAIGVPRRRGRPPKSAGTNSSRRGRPLKTLSLVMELEKEIEGRFSSRLVKVESQLNELKEALKMAQKREKAALKLLEKQEKALTRFISNWSTKEVAKIQKMTEPKYRRGRPRKNS